MKIQKPGLLLKEEKRKRENDVVCERRPGLAAPGFNSFPGARGTYIFDSVVVVYIKWIKLHIRRSYKLPPRSGERASIFPAAPEENFGGVHFSVLTWRHVWFLSHNGSFIYPRFGRGIQR